MKNKTEIRYWLKLEDSEIDILSTDTSKVPEKGEIIHFSQEWDEDRANRVYSHLTDRHKQTFFPKIETLINGYYVVVSAKRFIKTDYIPTKISEVFGGAFMVNSITASNNHAEIPTAYHRECFEIFIEPYKETELIATPISKLRNLLSPVLEIFSIRKAIKLNPGVNLIDIMDLSVETAEKNIPKILELLHNDNNWK